jgi:UDP-N-acetylmuramoyl-tripeptide--D-alanyl-D-alanine ligase
MFNFSSFNFYLILLISAFASFLFCFLSYNFFQGLQLSSYKIKDYFKWFFKLIKTQKLKVFKTLKNQKTPLIHTARIKRLFILFYVMNLSLLFIFINSLWQAKIYIIFAVLVIFIFLPLILAFAHIILFPIESLIKLYYLLKAKLKLKKHIGLIKIGITGSYGKTSTKFILSSILSQKFKICISPSSFNTPMGLSMVVNNYLKPDDEVLIAEMGAKRKGEIKFLCKLIKPQHAILTSIGNQHLETFKSVENIIKTKYEIIKHSKKTGHKIFNADNDKVKKLYDSSNEVTKQYVKLNDNDAYVTANNLKVTEEGSEFDLIIKGQKAVRVSTVLLGKHNIQNILMSVAMARMIGLSLKQIKRGVENLKPTPHRLEVIKSAGGVTILDDSFNASVEGSSSALEVLNLFKSTNKVVATCGLIELGEKAYESNLNLGKKIGEVASKCIIINEINKQAIKDGLIETGFKLENIYEVKSLKDAQELFRGLLKKGSVLLIENDLPDNFN